MWAVSWLSEGERSLWWRLSGPDRRHAVAVARRVSAALGHPDPGRLTIDQWQSIMAAALLHDIGKVEAGLGTCSRALTTAAAVVAGRDRLARGSGRVGRYLRHDTLGAALLESAGSDPLTVAWAREHHLSPARWTVPQSIGSALKAADDD